jgi:uncharacterized protein GlcG (DUF336 family)
MSEHITLEQARRIIETAERSAVRMGITVTVAVVDTGGWLVCLERMTGNALICIDAAWKKAYTSALMQMSTRDLYPLVQPGGPLFGLEHTSGGLCVFAGGVPLHIGGKFAGAVGVSGGTVEQDHDIAAAGAEALV